MKKTTYTLIILILLSFISAKFIGCGGNISLVNLSSHELFEMGKEKYQNKKYINAIEIFQAIVYNYPGESIIDTAQYFLALSYFGAEEYELAQVEFNRLVLNYPSSVYFEHAIFMKAASFFEATPKHYGLDQTDLETSIKQFEDFIIDYPESELIPDVQNYLLVAQTRMAKKYYSSGIVYSRMGAYAAAEIYFQKVVDDYTNTEFAPLATFMIAEMEFKQKKYDKARKIFEDFLIVFPEHEKTTKAKKYIYEAAFKSAKKAFENKDYVLAKERFEAFIKDFPKHKMSKKADKYLKKIKEIKLTNTREEDANS